MKEFADTHDLISLNNRIKSGRFRLGRKIFQFGQLVAISLFLWGCQCEEGSDDTGEDIPADPTIIAGQASSGSTSTITSGTTGNTTLAAGTYLMTPEQYTNYVGTALEYRYGWENNEGEFVDAITALYAIPLGGVDFQSSDRRDSVPKIQTLLVLRAVNWDVASAVVWRDFNPQNTEADILFTDLEDLWEDRPYTSAVDGADASNFSAGEARWQTQVESFYWRLFSRPPTSREVDLARTFFQEQVIAEENMVTAWSTYLYALLSTAEWWNP